MASGLRIVGWDVDTLPLARRLCQDVADLADWTQDREGIGDLKALGQSVYERTRPYRPFGY